MPSVAVHEGIAHRPRRRLPVSRLTALASLAAAALFAGLLLLLWQSELSARLVRANEAGQRRLALLVQNLQTELSRHDYLPTVLGLNPDVVNLLRQPGDTALQAKVNDYLERVTKQANVDAAYVLGMNGIAVAASNYRQRVSFVGEDLAFRPYFRDAVQRGRGLFYAIGTTSGVAGYFRADPILAGADRIGVVTLKVDLDWVETVWAAPGEIAVVTDRNGVMFLATSPAWRYKTLVPLSQAALEEIAATHQYDGVALTRIVLDERDGVARVPDAAVARTLGVAPDAPCLRQTASVPQTDWHITLLTDLRPAFRAARTMTALTATSVLLVAVMLSYLWYWRSAHRRERAGKLALQRAHGQLEHLVTERTKELVASNTQLASEMGERRRAEEELLHAAKLAGLGQMATSITHELNQPLAALRTLTDNALTLLSLGREEEARGNLVMLSGLTARMGAIVSQLRNFARKSELRLEAVSLDRAVSNALLIVGPRLRSEHVTVERSGADACARCDGNRLEQVLVNLLNNAIDAVAGREERLIQVETGASDGLATVVVRDTGLGLSEEAQRRLFEPFFTTKEAGVGLGLGLAISASLVREVGGGLRGANFVNGAEFVIELPAAERECSS
jgi:two-component system C4-dicarboxylate transport sensor histidine kinase DctB